MYYYNHTSLKIPFKQNTAYPCNLKNITEKLRTPKGGRGRMLFLIYES